jgi:hypothetical protein
VMRSPAGNKLGSQRQLPFSGCDAVVWPNAARRHFRRHQNRPDWRCFILALTCKRSVQICSLHMGHNFRF